METPKEYHERRIKEIEERIKYLKNCLAGSNDLKHIEHGVGKSYLKRRNSRMRQFAQSQRNQWEGEIWQLEIHLEKHKEALK